MERLNFWKFSQGNFQTHNPTLHCSPPFPQLFPLKLMFLMCSSRK